MICVGKCVWTKHINAYYYYDSKPVSETVESNDLKAQYLKETGK